MDPLGKVSEDTAGLWKRYQDCTGKAFSANLTEILGPSSIYYIASEVVRVILEVKVRSFFGLRGLG